MDTNEKKSHSKVCSSIPECLCPSVLIALLSSENESTPSSSLSNSWNTSLYSSTFSSDSCSSSYKQFSSTSYGTLFYSPYPPTQSAPLCQVCQLVPWFSLHSEQCGTNKYFINKSLLHSQRFLEAQPPYTWVCLSVCLSACLPACQPVYPFQLASGEVSQVFQVGFWCRKRQIWSTHRVDWDGDLKQCHTQTV